MASKILTFVDASVLIYAAVKPTPATFPRRLRALQVLGDPDRDFVASEYLRLEVMPVANYFNKSKEVTFYETFFASVIVWVDPTDIIKSAYALAYRHGLGALDALHGIEEALSVRKTLPNGKLIITAEGVKYNAQGKTVGRKAVVRYADDFVVFCESKEAAEQSVTTLTKWLNERGLEFSPEKTRIVHLTGGFDFLGFNVRLYQAPRTAKSGWKLLIKPSKESVTKIREKLRPMATLERAKCQSRSERTQPDYSWLGELLPYLSCQQSLPTTRRVDVSSGSPLRQA